MELKDCDLTDPGEQRNKSPRGIMPPTGQSGRSATMNRNVTYLVIGVLAAAVIIFGYLYYQESQSGVNIEIGEQGISIEGS